MTTMWSKPGASITVQKRPKTRSGLGGRRYVATVGNEQYGALTLESAQKWADAALTRQAV